MEELYENKTKYSEKLYNIFLNAYREEYASSENLLMIYNIGFFGICCIFAFIEKLILLGVVIIVGLMIYVWYKIIRPTIREEKTRKGPKLKGNFINTYKFYKNYFKVENPEGQAQVLYFKIYRVVETRDYYYIYISRENAFVMSKNSFTKGSSLEFTNFIKKKVLIKYKNRINKNKP